MGPGPGHHPTVKRVLTVCRVMPNSETGKRSRHSSPTVKREGEQDREQEHCPTVKRELKTGVELLANSETGITHGREEYTLRNMPHTHGRERSTLRNMPPSP